CVEDVSGRGGVDAIICNAGIMALPKLEQCFGIEKQFFTNHVGHFMLVTGLLPSLSSTGRVVMVSSAAHRAAPSAGVELDNLSGERGYSGWTAYGQSKIANLLFARHLATRFGDSGQTANALHPGVIYTNLARHMNPLVRAAWAIGKPLFLKTIPQGAATQVYLAVHPDGSKTNGEYFSDCNVAESRRRGRDAQLAARLWEKTEEIVASLP
ncbi:MAG: SDR family NAD(P)-dependent oxidoreductase, partial [Myxococcota bacterium]